jgi:predicted nuclease of predicted toxin-antitoxin system
MTAVRFQADADLKQSIVNGALRRQPNLDFQSANAAGFEGKKDREVLANAAQEGRVLVTHDRKTMPAEFGEFVMSQTSSGVLILSQNLSINEAIEALILIWEASTAEEWVDRIMSIPF